jgi:hypothetical protein
LACIHLSLIEDKSWKYFFWMRWTNLKMKGEKHIKYGLFSNVTRMILFVEEYTYIFNTTKKHDHC